VFLRRSKTANQAVGFKFDVSAKCQEALRLRSRSWIVAAFRLIFSIEALKLWKLLTLGDRAWLDETGAPLGVQQKLMRHAHISTTEDHYGNASIEAKRKANRPVGQSSSDCCHG
jgi:integrase